MFILSSPMQTRLSTRFDNQLTLCDGDDGVEGSQDSSVLAAISHRGVRYSSNDDDAIRQ